MEKSKSFQDPIVWQKTSKPALEVYRTTRFFPKEVINGMISPMRRSSSSLPSNIVEGYRQRGVKDKANFINISESSIDELSYQLIPSGDLNCISNEKYGQPSELGPRGIRNARHTPFHSKFYIYYVLTPTK